MNRAYFPLCCVLCCVRTFVYILYLFRYFFSSSSSYKFVTHSMRQQKWNEETATHKVKIKNIKKKQKHIIYESKVTEMLFILHISYLHLGVFVLNRATRTSLSVSHTKKDSVLPKNMHAVFFSWCSVFFHIHTHYITACVLLFNFATYATNDMRKVCNA